MKRIPIVQFSLKNRLLIFVVGILILSSVVVGVPSFLIAKNGLDQKGQIILTNTVEMVLMMIENKNQEVLSGAVSLDEAQEEIKQLLLGPKLSDGTRPNKRLIDLGENGYILIYDQSGNEVMHPTMEGINVWDLKFLEDSNRYLVREQIALANSGGGFLTYDWNFPNSTRIGEKYSYQKSSPFWGWVVVATAYKTDFNVEADRILQITIISIVLLLLLGFYITNYYLHTITRPLNRLRHAMNESKEGDFIHVEPSERDDEISELLLGYNAMVNSLEHVYKELTTRDKKIKQFAYYDRMTDLPNRHLLEETIQRNILDDVAQSFLVIFEIKDFKTLNAIYGTYFGDQVILCVGKVLLEYQKDTMFFGRYEGNEFVGWYKNMDQSQLLRHLHGFNQAVKKEFVDKKIDINIEFYITFSTYPVHGISFDELLKKANSAIRFVKTQGILAPVGFTKEIYEQIEYETILINLAPNAMEQKEFCLYYQEKTNPNTLKVEGVEALARWNSSELGFISPGIFIPLLSRSDLIIQLSSYIIKYALDDYPLLKQKYDEDVSLSINISPLFFHKSNFVTFVVNEIKERKIPCERIILEITEDILISDLDLIHLKIRELRYEGIKVALDDFGTGYSSLNYLSRMELDEVKIDKSFVDDIVDDEKAFAMFKSIVNIAQSFGFTVVAEGVETKEQADLILGTGCNLIQGYYYSKPMPLEKMDK